MRLSALSSKSLSREATTESSAAAPSGQGVQLSPGGSLGVAVSPVDCPEINLLGLNFSISPGGIKLPVGA